MVVVDRVGRLGIRVMEWAEEVGSMLASRQLVELLMEAEEPVASLVI